jgi:hypothetical protein
MRPLREGEGDGEGARLGTLRFLETLPLELPAPDLLDLAADAGGVDIRPVPRDVEVVPRWGVVFR